MNSLLKIAIVSSLAAAANAQAFSWTLQTTTSAPSGRERSATGTDGVAFYQYGGQVGSSTAGRDELWSYDGTDWTLLTASGASCGVRAGAIGAYDIARGKFVVFGGVTAFSGTTDFRLNDTWEWDAVNGWVQATPATVPAGRWLTPGVYVPGIGIVCHGGNIWNGGAPTQSNETWAFTGTDWVLLSTTGPAVQNHSMVYRDIQNDLLLHGGQIAGVPAGETWRFDFGTGTWAQIITATVPESNDNTPTPMFGHLSYYNPITGLTIVHGGGDNTSGNKTYQFDGTDWSEITTDGPRARNGGMHWVAVLGAAVHGPCNENNGTTFSRTRTHGPSVQAGAVAYGAGCAGLVLTPDNGPWVGTTFSATCSGMNPASLIKLSIWGFAATALPVTGLFGAGPGCTLLNTGDVIELAVSPTTTHTLLFAVPPTPALAGTDIFAQAGEVDLTLNNLALSNGLTVTIGG